MMKKTLIVFSAILLLRAHFARRVGRTLRAKQFLDRIRRKYPGSIDFLEAYYGFILICEDDVDGALKHFNSNLRSLPAKKTDDERYIELYCNYFIKAGHKGFDWESLIDEASRLRADSFMKRLLVFPSKDQLRKLLSA